MADLRIGILGCGKIADADHVPGYKKTKGVRIVALMDILPKKINALRKAQKLDAEGYTVLGKFLASDLDAISICTPNYLHYPQTMAALRAGVHVLCEKPMSGVLAQTAKMIDAARKANRVLQINQTFHYIPIFVKIAALVRGGAIGTPIHVRCLRLGDTTPDKSWSPGARWFVTKAAQGGVVLDIGVHMTELMQWVVGTITHVAALVDTRLPDIDVPDNATALMRFENGATGVLELSWTTPSGGMLLEIYGTGGTLRFGFDPKNPIELTTVSKKGAKKVTYPKPPAKIDNSQMAFVAAILGKAPSPTPGELGREAVALCDAILRSGTSGRFTPVRR
jgi:UDP-N-acetylglucosamine 3-dehydrogenase